MPAASSTKLSVPKNQFEKDSDKQNPLKRYIDNGFLHVLAGSLPNETPTNILEVGARNYQTADFVRKLYPDAAYTAIDMPNTSVASDWETRQVQGLFGEANQLPFSSDAFDLVLALEVLEHSSDPKACLKELNRVTSKNWVGSIVPRPVWRISNLVKGKYLTSLGRAPGHVNNWGTKKIRRLVSSELTVVKTQTTFPWTVVRAKV